MDNVTSQEELREVGEKGPPPKTRVKDALSAHAIVSEIMLNNQSGRGAAWADQKGMLDGNSPYDQGKLDSSGQAHRSNFPSLEGRAMVSSALTPYYELISAGKHIFNVVLDVVDAETGSKWSQICTEEADRRVKDEENFNVSIWQMLYDMLGFGRGHLIFDNPVDWTFHRVEFDRVMFPDGTNIDTRLWDYFVILQTVPVLYLWERIGQPGGSWEEEAVRSSIMLASPDRPEGGPFTDWMAVQRMLNDNDVWYSSSCKRVRLATLCVREYSGKWSQYVVNRDLMANWKEKKDKGSDGQAPTFLFKKTNHWERVQDFMNTFILEPREGSINGLSGIARDIYQQMLVKDRLQNALVDNGFLRSAMIMQATDASGYEDASVVMMGSQIIVPPGMNIQNSQIIGDVETALAVVRDMDMRIQNNTGIYRPQIVQASGNPRTATEAEFHFAQATALSSSAINRFYDQADPWGESLVKRMATSDKVYRKRCTDRGVPPEALTKLRKVSIERTIGSGSVSNRRNVLQSLMAFVGFFPESGRQNLVMDLTRALTDQTHTDRYLPDQISGTAQSFDEWAATQENASLKIGAPVIRTPQQNDYTHSVIHLGAAQNAVESTQQGAPLPEVIGFVENVLRHVITAHLPPLQASRPAEGKKIEKAVAELNDMLGELTKQVQQQQQKKAQQAQADSQLDADQELAQKKVQGEVQIKAAKATLDGKIKIAKAAETMEIQRAEAEQRMEIQAAEAEQKLQAERAKTRDGKPNGVWR